MNLAIINIGKTNINGNSVQTSNAREIHAFLEINKDFSSWIKSQIIRARLVDGRDYTFAPGRVSSSSGTKHVIDYYLTIDAAKQVAMMSETDKGFQVRDYYLECERRTQIPVVQLPQNFAQALRLAADQADVIEKQALQLESAKPAIAFHDSVAKLDGTCMIGHIAKTLGHGPNKLFARLKADCILMASRMPYQRYINAGYFEVREGEAYIDSKGNSLPTFTPVVTGKGQIWMARKYPKGMDIRVTA